MISSITRGKSFDGALRYVLDKDSATLLLSNVPATRRSPSAAATAMEQVAIRNDRVRQPVYHIAVSPAQTEQLDEGQWAEFGDRLLEELGLHDHQFVMGLHHDTTYPDSEQPRTHAHIVVNLVGFYGQRADTSWDYYRIQAAMRTLEREFELDSPFLDDGPTTPTVKSDTPGQMARYQREQREYDDPDHPRAQPPELSRHQQVQQHLDRALAESDGWDSFEEMLKAEGVIAHCSDHGWALEFETTFFAGYQLGKKYTYPAVVRQLGGEPSRGSPSDSQPTDASVAVAGPDRSNADNISMDSSLATTGTNGETNTLDTALGGRTGHVAQSERGEGGDNTLSLTADDRQSRLHRQPDRQPDDDTLNAEGEDDLPERHDAPAIPPRQWQDALLAQQMSAVVEAKAKETGEPASLTLQTSLGTLSLTDQTLSLTGAPASLISGATAEMPLFVATKREGQWDVSTNRLTDEAMQRIQQWPSTPYSVYTSHPYTHY